jgi:hypothetical protein
VVIDVDAGVDGLLVVVEDTVDELAQPARTRPAITKSAASATLQVQRCLLSQSVITLGISI